MRRRFFVEQFDGQRALVQGEKAHHLGRVLRAQAGQLYELSDGSRVCLGRIENVSRDRVEFALLDELPANEPALNVTLLLSVVKFDSFEWAIEKATESGGHQHCAAGGGAQRKGFAGGGRKAFGALEENNPGSGAAIAARSFAGPARSEPTGSGVCQPQRAIRRLSVGTTGCSSVAEGPGKRYGDRSDAGYWTRRWLDR